MNIKKINRELAKRYLGKVQAHVREDNRSIVVEGELDAWEDIISACSLCVVKPAKQQDHKQTMGDVPVFSRPCHVVNHIRFTGAEPTPMHEPKLKDTALEGAKPDVLVIGGGVCGCAIARELARYKLNILLVEKEADVAVQASSRNDGEVHPGVDQSKKNIKLEYELRGNRMYGDICRELGVPFQRSGQYVAFHGKWLKPVLDIVAASRRKIGVTDTKVVSKEALYKAIPNLKEGYDWGLYNPSAGTVCPYGLTIAYAENAVANGAKISLNTCVQEMEVAENRIKSVLTNRGRIFPKIVINAAGVFSDKIAIMAGDEFFSIHPRRGTEAVLDHKKAKLTESVVSFRDLFGNQKHTKGGGILPTVDQNILVGPDAAETYEREDYSTRPESIEFLFNKQRRTVPTLSERDIITYFTGVRAADFEEDFILEKGRTCENIVHCAAIQSPGLTAAPAIACDLAKWAVEMLGGAEENKEFNPIRKPIPHVRELPQSERAALIAKNPDYGIIVCRCEEISRGEILDALRREPCAPTVDGIKRRVRPGMGRCQGGFCGPVVTKIIAEELGTELSAVTKSGNESVLSFGGTK